MNLENFGFSVMSGVPVPMWVAPLVALFVVWALFWKGVALWHAARRGEKWWFVVMLIINTFGILEIVYLFVFAKVTLNNLFHIDK